MENKTSTLAMALFITAILCGAGLILFSFADILPFSSTLKGVRSTGFALLLFGAGEYLNHPLRRDISDPDKAKSRTRVPCGLGNLFDFLAILFVFAALTFFFFPYQP